MTMNSPILSFLEGLVSHGNSTGRPVIDLARTVINSPAVTLIVGAMNNPLESMLLGFARAILPPATPPAPVAPTS